MSDVVPVRTVESRDTVLAVCQERGDYWANANFRTMKQIPAIHEHEDSSSKKIKVGRPPEKQSTDTFLEVATFLKENDDEQITIQDLIQRMEENLANTSDTVLIAIHICNKDSRNILETRLS